ncbi:PilZ domain-containing protein [Thiohalorhabdus sp.]|uniref:PilZ domain-containing protein n=1 Tax=Thiohalorhabdus sp. TaxID=3094134 RepID=UPI002FC32154
MSLNGPGRMIPFAMFDEGPTMRAQPNPRSYSRLYTSLALQASLEPKGPWLWHAVQKPRRRDQPPKGELEKALASFEDCLDSWINLSRSGARLPANALEPAWEAIPGLEGQEMGLTMALKGRSDGPVLLWIPCHIVWAQQSPKPCLGVTWQALPESLDQVLARYLQYLERYTISPQPQPTG